MERAAFALGRAGRAREAAALLGAPLYARQKRVYAAGMAAFSRALRAQQDSASPRSARRSRWAPAAPSWASWPRWPGWVVGRRALWRWRGQLERPVAERTGGQRALTGLARGARRPATAGSAPSSSAAPSASCSSTTRGTVADANQAFAAFVGREAVRPGGPAGPPRCRPPTTPT
jgi:hypothetical protein